MDTVVTDTAASSSAQVCCKSFENPAYMQWWYCVPAEKAKLTHAALIAKGGYVIRCPLVPLVATCRLVALAVQQGDEVGDVVVHLPDFDVQIVKLFLQSVKTGKTKGSFDDLEQVCELGTMLQFTINADAELTQIEPEEEVDVDIEYCDNEELEGSISNTEDNSTECVDSLQSDMQDNVSEDQSVEVKCERASSCDEESEQDFVRVKRKRRNGMKRRGREKRGVRVKQEWTRYKGPYKCIICQTVCNTMIELKDHQRLMHRKFVCRVCNDMFSSRNYLEMHEMIHTGQKPYECKTCGAKFRFWSILIRHLKIHPDGAPDEQPHTSRQGYTRNKFYARVKREPKCEYDTTVKDEPVDEQINESTGEQVSEVGEMVIPKQKPAEIVDQEDVFEPLVDRKPIKCDLCGELFTFLLDLNAHMKIHDENMELG